MITKQKNRFKLQWHITNKCNNRCIHCYQTDYNGMDTNIQTAKEIIADFNFLCEILKVEPHFFITGGDPFLNSDIFLILDELKAKTNRISIIGNPEIILGNDLLIDFLKNIELFEYQLSLDGLEETHDKIRYKGSFKNTTNAIKELVSNGIKVSVMSTLSTLNIDELSNLMEFSYSIGVSKWTFARIVSENETDLPDNYDYFCFLKQITEKHSAFEKIGYSRLNKEPLLVLLSEETNMVTENRVCGGCGMGGMDLTLLPNNDIMACRRYADSVIGKWEKKNDFLNYFLYSNKMNEFRQIDKIEQCSECKYLYTCRGCRAIAFARTKSFYSADPQCFINNNYKNERTK